MFYIVNNEIVDYKCLQCSCVSQRVVVVVVVIICVAVDDNDNKQVNDD